MTTRIVRPITQERATKICRKLGLPITADLSLDGHTLHLRARGTVTTADEVRALRAFCINTDCPIHWHRAVA